MCAITEVCYRIDEYNREYEFILDGGSTCHVVKDEELVCRSLGFESEVNTAFGATASIKNVEIKPLYTDEFDIKIKVAGFNPKAVSNLLSKPRLMALGYTTDCFETKLYLPNSWNFISIFKKNNGLRHIKLQIKPELTCFTSDTAQTWKEQINLNFSLEDHCRSAHTLPTKEFCHPCAQAKSKRFSHAKTNKHRVTDFNERVGTDLCSPISPPSYGGAKYYQSLIDSGTSWCEVQPIKTKNETEKGLNLWRDKHHLPKSFRFDNGNEFKGQFMKALRKNDVTYRTTSFYQPE